MSLCFVSFQITVYSHCYRGLTDPWGALSNITLQHGRIHHLESAAVGFFQNCYYQKVYFCSMSTSSWRFKYEQLWLSLSNYPDHIIRKLCHGLICQTCFIRAFVNAWFSYMELKLCGASVIFLFWENEYNSAGFIFKRELLSRSFRLFFYSIGQPCLLCFQGWPSCPMP